MGILRWHLRLSKLSKNKSGYVGILVGHCRSNFVLLPRSGMQGGRKNVGDVIRRNRPTGYLLRGPPLICRIVSLLKALILVSVCRGFIPPNTYFPICHTMVITFRVLLCLFRLHVVPRPTSAFSTRFHRIITSDGRLVPVRRRVKQVCLSVRQDVTDVSTKGRSRSTYRGRPGPSREMGPPPHKARVVHGHPTLVHLRPRPRVGVPRLRYGEGLVRRFRDRQVQVATLRACIRNILVSIKRTNDALTRYPSTTGTVRRRPVRRHQRHRGGGHPLPSYGR